MQEEFLSTLIRDALEYYEVDTERYLTALLKMEASEWDS